MIDDIATGRVEAFDRLKDPREEHPLLHIPEAVRTSLDDWNEHAFGIDDPAMFWPYRSPACRP